MAPIGELVPEAIVDGAVDRAILGSHVLPDGDKLKALEAIVHPWPDGRAVFDRSRGSRRGFQRCSISRFYMRPAVMVLSTAWWSYLRLKLCSASGYWRDPAW